MSDSETPESLASAVDSPLELERLAGRMTADIIEAQEAQAIFDLMKEMLMRNGSSAIATALVALWTTGSG